MTRGYRQLAVVAAPEPTAIQPNNSKQQEARACVFCLCKCGKFATQALFSIQVMALGSTNREVNMTAGEVLFLRDKASCIISSASNMASKGHKQKMNKLSFLNLHFFF